MDDAAVAGRLEQACTMALLGIAESLSTIAAGRGRTRRLEQLDLNIVGTVTP